MSLVLECLRAVQAAIVAAPRVADLRVGVFYTAVRIETGHVGLAYTPRDTTDTVCCPRTAAEAPPAGDCTRADAYQLAAYATEAPALKRAIGVATLNALSALALERRPCPQAEAILDLDALEAAEVRARDRVALVGAFPPLIKALTGRVAALTIIDRHREALKPHELPMWQPPETAAEALGAADVAIITGSSLVEGGLEVLLEASRAARVVMLAGPTASLWPDPFFAAGVDIMAGVAITEPERALRVVSEGGAGYFFQTCTRKRCLRRRTPRAPDRHARRASAAVPS